MELKQKIKKQDVQRLRRLIQAVADKNGEEATLPFSFLPFRGIIMVISLAGLAYGVVATFVVTISTIFFTELTMQQPGKGYQDRLFGNMMLDWVIMFAFIAFVLYCCYKSVYWEWNKLVVRGNKDVTTWKAAPREASREAVEALQSYIHEHTTITEESTSKVEEEAASSVGDAINGGSEVHEANRKTKVESSRVRTLRNLLEPVLEKSGREEQLPKSTFWLRIFALITVVITGIIIGQWSGIYSYSGIFIEYLMSLRVDKMFGIIFIMFPFVLFWLLHIAVIIAVWSWHRKETFKEWKELLVLAGREVEMWNETAVVPKEVVELQKFLKKAHKNY